MTDELQPAADSVEDVLEFGEAQTLGSVIADLYAVVQQRLRDLPQDSYTAALLTGPEDMLLKKIGEEATEVVMAGKDHDVDHLRYETADLLYHLLVVMVREGLTLDDLAGELASRFK